MAYILGMDTGGSYTDGVLLDSKTKEVISKAKALTTKDNLIIGITECIEALTIASFDSVDMVCLSTTLATNAVVEGKGCPVGLIEIGKRISGTIPAVRSYYVSGRFSIQGRLETPLDIEGVKKAYRYMENSVDAIVVSGYASTRNPEHEMLVKSMLTQMTDKPVICAHEITGKLGYYNRTVTALLNASLIPIIKNLIEDTKKVLRKKGIKAPVMIVKGDGNFMTSYSAEEKPIETILSGPAASIIGAKYLSEIEDCTVIDIGGTTSDIARLENGCVKIDPSGANVGGWQTQVRAADIFTKGIGGDSRLRIGKEKEILFGPDKAIPLSLYYKNDSLDIEKLVMNEDASYAFTPTDLAHAEKLYDKWNKSAADKGITELSSLLCMTEEKTKKNLYKAFYQHIYDALVDSMKFDVSRTVVAIGAPAAVWMPRIASDYDFDVVVPEHAEVANAIGAAVGHIEEKAEILIRKDQISGDYMIFSQNSRKEMRSLEAAKEKALEEAHEIISSRMKKSHVSEYEILEDVEDINCDLGIDKREVYVETRISVVATGKPDGIV